jgi:hypothetical protein
VLLPLSCSHCGAALAVPAGTGQKVLTCSYCGQSHAFLLPPPAPPGGAHYAAGERVAVEWGGRWWPAVVVQPIGATEWRVHFEGWGQNWDTVVGPSRIRQASAADARPAGQGWTTPHAVVFVSLGLTVVVGLGSTLAMHAAGERARQSTLSRAPVAQASELPSEAVISPSAAVTSPPAAVTSPPEGGYRVGDAVNIEWKGTWWAGRILEVEGEKHKITYDGYGSNWDEWVGTERLRPRR